MECVGNCSTTGGSPGADVHQSFMNKGWWFVEFTGEMPSMPRKKLFQTEAAAKQAAETWLASHSPKKPARRGRK